MTHQACQEKLLDLAYGELDPAEAAEVEAHLESCELCRAERASLQGVRSAMRQLEPELPPAHGEHLLLTAARHAVEHHPGQRRFLPPWIWRLALTATALAVVGTVSFRVLNLRGGRQDPSIEGRPGTFGGSAEPSAILPAPAPAPAAPAPAPAERPRSAGQGAKSESHAQMTTPEKKYSLRKGGSPSPVLPGGGEREARGLGKVPSASGPESQLAPPPAPAPVAKKSLRGQESLGAADTAAAAEEMALDVDQLVRQPEQAKSAPPQPAARPAVPKTLSAENEQRARQLRSAQELVQEIEEARRQRQLVESVRPVDGCGPGEDSERRLYSRDGRVVEYERRFRRQELVMTLEQFYDPEGNLRHLRVRAAEPSGASFEQLLWLDSHGNRLLEERRGLGEAPRTGAWRESDLNLRAPDGSVLTCGAP